MNHKTIRDPKVQYRRFDGKTPNGVHPIWCATTILAEKNLSEDIRTIGFYSLAFHDWFEEREEKSFLALIEDLDCKDVVLSRVKEMTFNDFAQEIEMLDSKSDECKLFKLYDKVSNLLDSSWMRPALLEQYIDHTTKLTQFVLKRYGEINIVSISQGVLVNQVIEFNRK